MRLRVPIFIVMACLTGCQIVNHKVSLRDDDIADETFEKKVHQATGLNIDLSKNDG